MSRAFGTMTAQSISQEENVGMSMPTVVHLTYQEAKLLVTTGYMPATSPVQ